MKRSTLSHRLNVLVALWFVVCAIVGGSLSWMALSSIRRDIEDDRALLAGSIARGIDRALRDTLLDLEHVGRDLRSIDEGAASRLRDFRFRSPFSRSVTLTDADLRPLVTDPPSVPAPTLASAPAAGEVTGVLPGSPPTVALVHAFRSGGNGYHLLATMEIGESELGGLLSDLSGDPNLATTIVDRGGTVLASAAAEPSSGEQAFVVRAPLELAPWTVVVAEPRRVAFRTYFALRRALWVTGTILVVAGFALARALSRSVVQPIHELSEQAETLRQGELSIPLEVAGDDEIATLATTLDEARLKLAAAMEESATLNRELEERVRERTDRLRTQARQRRRLVRRLLGAGEEERRRIARELHDETSQLLTAIQLAVDGIDGDEAELKRIQELLRNTQDEIHRVVHDLRPTLLDDLGLGAAIESHAVEYLGRHGVGLQLEIQPDLPARGEIDVTLFRIWQEIATNILRHSRAGYVSVELYELDGKRVLSVEDDGVGFATEQSTDGAGLVGMRERAELVNGTIRVDSEPGLGTHIVVEIGVEP